MRSAKLATLAALARSVAAKLPDDPQGQALVLGLEAEQAELELQADELRESQRHASELVVHYRQLFAESPLAIVLLSPTRHVRELNHRALTTLGLASTPLSPVPFERFVFGEDIPAWSEIARRVGEEPQGCELRVRRLGGEVRRCVLTIGRRASGELLLSLDDVTELRRAEERRRVADARLAEVLRGSHDGVLFADASTGLVVEVNRAFARALNCPPDALVGRPLDTLFSPDERARQDVVLRKALAGQIAGALALSFRRTDGANVDTEVTVGQIDEGGRALVCLLVRDVNDRRRLERERLQLAEAAAQHQRLEALGQLAAGIAHDFNNMLTGVLACAEPESSLSIDEARERLEEVRVAAMRGRELTQRLGAIARRTPIHARPFDLYAVIREVSSLLRRTLPPGISIEEPAQGAAFRVRGDEGEWQRALLNLGVNARDAMPHGGRLRFEARPHPDGGQTLVVSDTGLGMTPEVRARAFEPFFTTKPLGKGTGLGLAHVHAVARSHGVPVQLESSPGRGATFTFHFPAAVEAPPPPKARETGEPSRTGWRVLLVDDDELARRGLARQLKRLGCEIVEVDGGVPALARLREGLQVDLVLSDLSMPGLDGEQLAHELRTLHPGLPLLVATGEIDGLRRERLEALGTRVLGKPFESEELLAAARELVQRRASGS